MSTSPVLDMYSITAQTMQINSLSIPVQICDTDKTIETLALIDSRAGGKFIDQNYVQRLGIKTQELEQPLTARNVDGTPNKKGKITSFVILTLVINRRTKRTRLLVTGLGRLSLVKRAKPRYKLAN